MLKCSSGGGGSPIGGGVREVMTAASKYFPQVLLYL